MPKMNWIHVVLTENLLTLIIRQYVFKMKFKVKYTVGQLKELPE